MRQFNLIKALVMLVSGVLVGWIAVHMPSKEERARRRYESHYPCIYGIRYIRSGYSGRETLTPMIDPATMQPLKCNSEAPP